MNRIKSLRKYKKWSQQLFAEKFNVDQTAVSNWETGKNNVDIDTAKKIALEFNVPLEYIYGEAYTETRPMSKWSSDEIEDYENTKDEARDYLRFIYGRGEFRKKENYNVGYIANNNGVISAHSSTITINNNIDEGKLDDIEKLLITICRELDAVKKIALLTRASELLEESRKN